MKNESKKYKINIFGESYTLVSDETESHVADAASMVDELMTKFAENLVCNDAKKLAVLVALQLSSELHHSKSQLTHYQSEKQRLVTLIDQGLGLCNLS